MYEFLCFSIEVRIRLCRLQNLITIHLSGHSLHSHIYKTQIELSLKDFLYKIYCKSIN